MRSNPTPPAGRVMPSCTTARGHSEALIRGRDDTTRFGPRAMSVRPPASADLARLPARREK